MSDSQTIWAILWGRAAREKGPFEIDEVAPEVAKALGEPESNAKRQIGFLLEELNRMPDGKQFFIEEGEAAVPLPEFFEAVARGVSPGDAYPFEL